MPEKLDMSKAVPLDQTQGTVLDMSKAVPLDGQPEPPKVTTPAPKLPELPGFVKQGQDLFDKAATPEGLASRWDDKDSLGSNLLGVGHSVLNDLGAGITAMATPLVHPLKFAESLEPHDWGERLTGPAGVLFDRMIAEPFAKREGETWGQYGSRASGQGVSLLPSFLAAELAPEANGVGSALRRSADFVTATPEARTLAATRFFHPGNFTQALGDALAPTQAEREGFITGAEELYPKIKSRGNGTSQYPQSVEEVANNATKAAAQMNKRFHDILQPWDETPVDTTEVKDAINDSVSPLNRIETPSTVGRTSRIANRYAPQSVVSPILDESGKPFTSEPVLKTLGEIDTLRKNANQKLRGYYEKNPGSQYGAEANPNVARMKVTDDALRNLEYRELSRASGVPEDDIRQMQIQYGGLRDLADMAEKQSRKMSTTTTPTAGRLDVPLSKHGMVSRLANTGLRKLVGDVESPDAMVRSASDRFQNPTETPLPMTGGAGAVVAAPLRFGTRRLTYGAQALPLIAPLSNGIEDELDDPKVEKLLDSLRKH